MLKEFKEFAMRGSVVDLAVGVIIGAAFGAIVKLLVDDVIMPPIGLLLGGIDFSNLFITLSGDTFNTLAQAQEAGAVTINYGIFFNAIIQFLIVAFVIFMVIKQMNNLKRQEEEAPAEPPAPPKEEVLLEEIRDILKTRGA